MRPEHLDMFIHLDTEELQYLYDWRVELEQKLLRQTG